ncbi:ASCH domain-containing protein [Alteraurantiacibacter buctensis]|uniref:ASCH domain-containing protein n=1 Tax=Alteraurantiacibacter buctensis TaxID=1503981 RepID=A0A844Z6N9_9SPHN|nr:ASCH domain-containing protein [Alteraurantiacibacter buctensis]MXO73453.1 ASCH domain-containing protein [Alteraurantiacibacter buctensis]
MKALTIWQPWASLIIAGAKPYEFRSWRPPASIVGQRIVIHAASRKIDVEEACLLYRVLANRTASPEIAAMAAETCLHAELALPILGGAWMPYRAKLPMSCGIGTAIVGEPRLGTEIAAEFGVLRANDSDRDDHANWGWPMLDIEAWVEPVPMRGKQGLWNWPQPEWAAS